MIVLMPGESRRLPRLPGCPAVKLHPHAQQATSPVLADTFTGVLLASTLILEVKSKLNQKSTENQRFVWAHPYCYQNEAGIQRAR